MHNHDALPHTLAAYACLIEHAHIDDAVDHLADRIGWDAAFQTLAALDEPRASMGLYSLVCGLFISDSNT